MKTTNLTVEPEFDKYFIAPPIKKMLDKAKHLVKNEDWDRVFLIDGNEGCGKSLLGLQLGYYLDPTLSLDRIVFTGQEFADAINKAEKNQCIIFDEAFNGLSSSGSLSQMNKLIVRKLMECRQKNLYLIIILPTIFLLQKYAAVFRSRALFHVYATKKGKRGYYKVYNLKNKKILYLFGAKLYDYRRPYIKKSYRFYGKYPIDEIEYRKKKLDSLEDKKESDKEESLDTKNGRRAAVFAIILKEHFKIHYVQLEEKLKLAGVGLDSANIARNVAKIPENLRLQIASI